jgi:MFS family permease
VLLLAALLLTSFGADYQGAVMAGLILIGLGWSASTVAASALVAESADPLRRTAIQGRADLLMSAAGALGGALAGPALAVLAYNGLALAAVALVAVVLIAVALRTARRAQPAT